MTSFAMILNDLFDSANKKKYIENLCNYDLLIIDDLGSERHTEYSLENVFLVIDERYKAGKPMIVTTNMTIKEMENTSVIELRRIYDRVLENCLPVCVTGESIRKQNKKIKMEQSKSLLCS